MRTIESALGLEQCSCGALRRAARRASQFYDAKLAPSGLRVSQFSMLVVLEALGGATVNELAHQLGLDRTTTGKNLRPLQRGGLVVVGRSARDGRSREASITSVGFEKLAEARPLWRAAQQEFDRMNGREAMADLRARLKRLAVRAEEMARRCL